MTNKPEQLKEILATLDSGKVSIVVSWGSKNEMLVEGINIPGNESDQKKIIKFLLMVAAVTIQNGKEGTVLPLHFN